jgi:hypothetical protein
MACREKDQQKRLQAPESDMIEGNLASFTEWADELDRAYDALGSTVTVRHCEEGSDAAI